MRILPVRTFRPVKSNERFGLGPFFRTEPLGSCGVDLRTGNSPWAKGATHWRMEPRSAMQSMPSPVLQTQRRLCVNSYLDETSSQPLPSASRMRLHVETGCRRMNANAGQKREAPL